MATTFPAAAQFAALLPLASFAASDVVTRELYGRTVYAVDETAARAAAASAGLAPYFDEVHHLLQRRVDALNARNA